MRAAQRLVADTAWNGERATSAATSQAQAMTYAARSVSDRDSISSARAPMSPVAASTAVAQVNDSVVSKVHV